ncbi:hypothetical protein BJ138DRAFT_1225749 [Hygrophoropsis aurantiaca]|uniref:Uncharacterized protein n=1 Tax=Hygrophoropsis aurantiaca TaxID=72124 RepID=A0ACB8A029_9AGAM|nr:hypothetical protein BJ138DRAFT_1225749 [Hygrophoropsis aurantiaca]
MPERCTPIPSFPLLIALLSLHISPTWTSTSFLIALSRDSCIGPPSSATIRATASLFRSGPSQTDTFAAFKQFKAYAENQTGRKPDVYLRDHGGAGDLPAAQDIPADDPDAMDDPDAAANDPVPAPAPLEAPVQPAPAAQDIPADDPDAMDDPDAAANDPVPAPAPLEVPVQPAVDPAPAESTVRPPSPVGIGARLPARARQPPRDWWVLPRAPRPVLANDDDEDNAEYAHLAFWEEDDDEFVLMVGSSGEPLTYAEALRRPDAEHWRQAALEELAAHKSNRTWRLVERPTDRNVAVLELLGFKQTYSDASIYIYSRGDVRLSAPRADNSGKGRNKGSGKANKAEDASTTASKSSASSATNSQPANGATNPSTVVESAGNASLCSSSPSDPVIMVRKSKIEVGK